MFSLRELAKTLQPPLRAGVAYEDLADAIGAKKRGVAEAVATRVSAYKLGQITYQV